MSITAIFVFTSTTFTTDKTSTIEQLVENETAPYSVVPTQVVAGNPFTLNRGAYRLNSGASITAAPGSVATTSWATDRATGSTSHVIRPMDDTKDKWPDPTVAAVSEASTQLKIPLADLKSFLTGAGQETELDPPAAPSKPING